jgi:6-phosphofructokinase 1
VSGCIVSANSAGDITPLYLSDFEQDGKIPPRLVEIDSQMAKLFFNNMHYISKQDYQEAYAYLEDPSSYEFNRILNW